MRGRVTFERYSTALTLLGRNVEWPESKQEGQRIIRRSSSFLYADDAAVAERRASTMRIGMTAKKTPASSNIKQREMGGRSSNRQRLSTTSSLLSPILMSCNGFLLIFIFSFLLPSTGSADFLRWQHQLQQFDVCGQRRRRRPVLDLPGREPRTTSLRHRGHSQTRRPM